MMNVKAPAAGLMVLTLAACGGGGGGDDTIVSSGILQLELPDSAAQASLPMEVQTLVGEVIDSNENSGDATQPMGNTTYSGSFAIQVDETDGAVISGTAALTVDGAAQVDYDFAATTIDNPGSPNASITGTIGADDVGVTGGLFIGGLSGTLTYDEDSTDMVAGVALTVTGTVDGAFDANADGFGTISGNASNGGAAIDDDFDGVFHTTLDP